MKTLKKLFCLVMALAMIAALGVSAMAADNGSITVSNPSNGVSYTLYKIFDATLDSNLTYDATKTSNDDHNGTAVGIQYSATVDQYNAMQSADYTYKTDVNAAFTFTPYYAADGTTVAGYYVTAKSDSAVLDYLKKAATVAEDGTITCDIPGATMVTKQTCNNNSTISWTGLKYGYYIILNDLQAVAAANGNESYAGSAVTVNSTTPNVTVIAKNDASPITNPSKKDSRGTTEGDVYTGGTYAIGETVTYTVSFNTTNYDSNNKPIYKYVITDTLPTFLSSVSVQSIKIDEVTMYENGALTSAAANSGISATEVAAFATGKTITIPWVDSTTYAKLPASQSSVAKGSYSMLYAAGAKIEIVYTATVNDAAVVDSAGNANSVTISANPFDPGATPVPDPWTETKTDTIYTYAGVLIKVDATDSTKTLKGATFEFTGYNLSAPQTVTDKDGKEVAVVYTVTSPDTTTTKHTVTTGESGVVIIRGINNADLVLTETAAPEGYNLASETATLHPIATGEKKATRTQGGEVSVDGTVTTTYSLYTTSNSEYIDNHGLAASASRTSIPNGKGVELPATGGIGTTIFYVVGGILVVGAGVLLITKKRMAAKG